MNNKILKALNIDNLDNFPVILSSKVSHLLENSYNNYTIVLNTEELLPIKELELFLSKNKYKHMKFDIKLENKNKSFSFEQLLDYITFILKKYKSNFNSNFFKFFTPKRDKNICKEDNNIIFNIIRTESNKESIDKDLFFMNEKLSNFGIDSILKINFIDLNEDILNSDNFLTENQNTISKKTFYEKESSNTALENNNEFKNLNTIKKDCIPNFDTISNLRQKENIDFDVQINATIYNIEQKEITAKKNGQKYIIFNFSLTDKTESILLIIFIPKTGNWQFKVNEYSNFKINDLVCVKGQYKFNDFNKHHLTLSKGKYTHFHKISNLKKADIKDDAPIKRVELHCHTKMSTMDGIVSGKEYMDRAYELGHDSIAITDFNNVQSFPELHNHFVSKYQNKNFKLIYGSEFNLINKNINVVYNPNNNNLYNTKYVIFDIETTGLSPFNSEIIEFGAVIYDPKTNKMDQIDILIKPNEKLSDFTKNLTHLDDDLLEKEGIDIKEAMQKIIKIFDNNILVAHNAKFDMSFIHFYANKLNMKPINNTVIDTLPLSQFIWSNRKSYNLKSLCKFNKIEYREEEAHRADYDAKVLCLLFENILQNLKQRTDVKNISTDNDLLKLELNKENVYSRTFGHHGTILVKNQTGLLNLFKLISKTHTETFFGSPKIFKESIENHREGLLIGTGVINSELFEFVLNKPDDTIKEILSFYDYIELQPPSLFEHLIQKQELNHKLIVDKLNKIIELGLQLNKIIIATCTPRYLDKEQSSMYEVLIHSKRIGGKMHPLYDSKKRIKNYPIYNFKTTNEMLNEFKFIKDEELRNTIVIKNTNLIKNQIDQVYPIKDKLYTPIIEDADNKLKEVCYQNAIKIYGNNLPEIVKNRLDKELNSIIKHGFSVIYWISHKLVTQSINDGYLVGSRGSVGSSFVATMAKITEINPLKPHYICHKCQYTDFSDFINVKSGYDLKPIPCPKCQNIMTGDGHNIPFETFLGFEANKVPDIDLNFSSEYQHKAHDFIKDMFGEDNVLRAGTISTVASKTAYGYVKNFLEMKNIQKSDLEISRLAKGCEGVKRTTGQHPGGIIIIPKEFNVNDFTPLNFPADDKTSNWKTSHFDFHAIHDNVLKLDILGHIDPTALKFLYNSTGIDPKTIPTHDDKVLSLFSNNKELNFINPENIDSNDTGALGIPEFGTNFVREMLKITRPKSFADLVQISGLSHGTDVWIDNAQYLIEKQNIKLSEVIGCRDDIMTYLINKNVNSLVAFEVMESVRKGKGIPKQHIRVLEDNRVPTWYIDSCNKIKYMFPKAHAAAYVLMAWRIAWYKINFPAHYYAVFFTTRTEVFDIETVLKGPGHIRDALEETIKKINNKKADPKDKELKIVYEVALEMWERGIEMQNINLKLSDVNEFKVLKINNKDIIIPPFTAIDGLGITIAKSIVDERKNRNGKDFISVEDFKTNTNITKTHLKIFQDLKVLEFIPDNSQLQIKV